VQLFVALTAFIKRHRQGLHNCVADRLRIMGVKPSALWSILARARETRQNEHAGVFGILRCNIFFCHEIHTVAQRRHQRGIRDRDCVYGTVPIRRLHAIGIRDKPAAPGSPWQNGFAERLIGSIRRE
jgi:hypothetical protein